MYKGFNLSVNFEEKEYFDIGSSLYEAKKKQVNAALEIFLNPSGSINASALQAGWFPQITADIFLSHSHADKDLAITLTGLLESIGLKVFIDSCIWGNADDLLRKIDNRFCYNEESEKYSYERRNISTSHVHMMLSVALTMMIDRSECLFFLNTPNSITSKDVMSHTASSWLYAEISMAALVRERKLTQYRRDLVKGLTEAKAYSDSLNFEFDVPLGHLQDLTGEDLAAWIKMLRDAPRHPLDKLYELKAKNKQKLFRS